VFCGKIVVFDLDKVSDYYL